MTHWFLQSRRVQSVFLHDLVMAGISFPLSLYLRLGDTLPLYSTSFIIRESLLFMLICAPVFLMSRLYQGVWRYASLNDLLAITKAVTLAILIFLPVLFSLTRLELLPRSLPIINWFVLMLLLGGPRLVYRIVRDRRLMPILDAIGHHRIPVLLAGAGDEAESFIRSQNRNRDSLYQAVALLSHNKDRIGQSIHQVPIIGSMSDVTPDVWKKLPNPPEKIIITSENLDGAIIRRLFELAQAEGLTLARLPKQLELKDGLEDQIADRPIIVEDLLGRPQASLDIAAIRKLVTDRRVLVTGAGGSIGSELVRQICALSPAKIILLDHSEYQLYLIDQEVTERFPNLSRLSLLANVRNRNRINHVMKECAPELVFHAAALKHVPMVEDNPLEGILSNVMGSRIVAEACHKIGVRCMVQISTDKAVNPTNLMGATKRLAEEYIQAMDLATRQEGGTRYLAVRFGNVLGSTGSVVPLFQKQLAAGGPLTVTHPDITRYFMTIREAVQLVLQASTLGVKDDEAAGKIFVLDMGQPVKIADLARQMILLAGKQPEKDIAIEYTGLRPGEKLYEELLHGEEKLLPTKAEGIMLAEPRHPVLKTLLVELDRLEEATRAGDLSKSLGLLQKLVPEFTPDTQIAKHLKQPSARQKKD